MTDSISPISSEHTRLALLYRVSREISGRLDLAELLPRLLKETVESTQADTGSLIVFDEQGGILHSAVMTGGRFQPDVDRRLATTLDHGLAGWVAANRQAALVPDTAQDPRWLQRPDDQLLGPKSAVCAPLLGRERVVGVMTVVKLPARSFGDADLSLLTAIAEQAGIAIENAQLFASEHRRREINHILGEIARVINATLDTQQVLHLVLEQLARVVRYDSASILLREGDRLRVSAVRGFQDEIGAMSLVFDSRAGLAFRAVREKRCLIVNDVRATGEWFPTFIPETESIRGWIGAPLLIRDEAIGLLCVDSQRPAAYTQEDGQWVTAFAEHAATAVFNARLFAENENRLKVVQALAAASQAVNSTLQLDEVLRLIVRHAQSLLRAEAASVALRSGDRLIYREAVGAAGDKVRGKAISLEQGIAGWVARNGQPALVPDVDQDPRFFRSVDKQTGFVTRAVASVPLRANEQVIGVIEVLNPVEGFFDPETLNILGSLGSLAATAIVRAQWVEDLQAAESRFAGLFQDSIDPILITDLGGVITDANRRACEFFGYPPEELIHMRVTTVHRMGTGWLESDPFRTLQGGSPITYQTRITTRDGVERPVEVHAKLIRRGQQEFIQWIQHDLSERLALEELRNDLISMVAHDLRSPLSNIASSLEVVQSSLPPESDVEQSLLAIALRSTGRMARLVDSLLDLRRLEAGQMVLNRQEVNVNLLVADVVEQVQSTADGKMVQIRTEVPPRLPFAEMDVDMIRRVLLNLVENAVKYLGGAGTITILARAEPEAITLSVRDTGPGIPRSEHTRIFDRFARVRQAGGPKGLGLGLAFCKLAVEAHGGRIWVESQPGHGATFSFRLPFAGGPDD